MPAVGHHRCPGRPDRRCARRGGGVTSGHLPRWTHIALRVRDIDASIEFYTQQTPLELLDRRQDDDGFGAWLGHRDSPDAPFILVLAQFLDGHDPFGGEPARLGPFAHLGIELESREAVDQAAARAEAGGFLQSPPIELPQPIGYVCMVNDPDRNTIEFSFDQGVFAFAQQHMR
ncbi:MAG: VOC family protein [Ilumatobacter sp.]|nr:VOC family protein [Ilumatobacter sp.]